MAPLGANTLCSKFGEAPDKPGRRSHREYHNNFGGVHLGARLDGRLVGVLERPLVECDVVAAQPQLVHETRALPRLADLEARRVAAPVWASSSTSPTGAA